MWKSYTQWKMALTLSESGRPDEVETIFFQQSRTDFKGTSESVIFGKWNTLAAPINQLHLRQVATLIQGTDSEELAL